MVACGRNHRLQANYGKFADLALATRSHSAVEPGLRFVSPENGNIAEDAQRFPARHASNSQGSEHRDNSLSARSPPMAGFFAEL